MISKSGGSQGDTGLSAPKRYLCDVSPSKLQWYINSEGTEHQEQKIVGGSIMPRLTPEGELLSRVKGASPAIQAKFSKSSIFMFMIMEIFCHAFRQINDVSYRQSSGYDRVPRLAKRLILTIPSATPIIEQELFKMRAEDALKLLWEIMGWGVGGVSSKPVPELVISYDEASCTQIIYLYSEIIKKFVTTPHNYIKLKSTSANGPPSLRIASIDIGGGTTDLMISSYSTSEKDTSNIKLTQNFREGFREAGDDIVHGIISNEILPQIIKALADSGCRNPSGLINSLFVDASHDYQYKHKRKLFVNEILIPIAYSLINLYETMNPHVEISDPISFVDIFKMNSLPSEKITQFLDDVANENGAQDFALSTLPFHIHSREIFSDIIRSVMADNFKKLSKVINAFSCDYLLVTGRPSKLPVIREMILEEMSVQPNRVVFMHDYTVGSWYPFVQSENKIGDPKTTVVVGALLCSMAERVKLEDFGIQGKSFHLPSTANYIGKMDPDGKIRAENVFFQKDSQGNFPEEGSKELVFSTPTTFGFRQLDDENWRATKLYSIQLASSTNTVENLPWKIRFHRAERDEKNEKIKISEITDSNDDEIVGGNKKISLRLQTISESEGYWLDTGNVAMPVIRQG